MLDGNISVTVFRSRNAHRVEAECAEKSLKIFSAHPLRSQRLCGETIVTYIPAACN